MQPILHHLQEEEHQNCSIFIFSTYKEKTCARLTTQLSVLRWKIIQYTNQLDLDLLSYSSYFKQFLENIILFRQKYDKKSN